MDNHKHTWLRDEQSLVSAGLHAFGLLGAIVGTLALSGRAHSTLTLISMLVYGTSMICLYASSTIYHIFYVSKRTNSILRKIDHIMIFFLIAGTYTPMCLSILGGTVGWILLSAVWTLSIAGIFMAIFWINAPKWVSALCYVLLGWMVVFAAVPLSQVLPAGGMWWLIAGGLWYTVGAVIYAMKPKFMHFRYFGNHELFHVFVLLGSICHYIFIYRYA